MHYSFKSTPSISFKFRTETVTKSNHPSNIPGPGQYNAKKPLPRSGTIATTKQKRQLFKNNSTGPGPGSYQSISFITTGPKRSMSAKIIRQPIKIPGPQDYQNNLYSIKNKSPSFSFGNKCKSIQKIIQDQNAYKPGPGNYYSQESCKKSTGVFFGSSNRKDLTETQKTPAPTHYNSQKARISSPNSARCIIGGQKRQLKISLIENTPGPAAYDNKDVFQQNLKLTKGFSCRQRLKDLVAQQLSKNPAPGEYKSQNLIFQKIAPRFVFSKQKRKTFIDMALQENRSNNSNHQINYFTSSKYKSTSISIFGRSERKQLDENEKTPGPVAYKKEKSKILKSSPSFSCPKTQSKQQFLQVMDPQIPGPGTYDYKIDLTKQKTKNVIVLKDKRPTYDKQKQKPGPGFYNIETLQKGPKFSFTQQKRQLFKTDKNSQQNDLACRKERETYANYSSIKTQKEANLSPTKSNLGSTGF